MDVVTSGLSVDFPARGIRALDDVSIRIGSGEHVALLGPSGAGKSTLLRALLAAPTAEGSVRVGGRDVVRSARDARAVRRESGFLRQGGDLVLELPARLNAIIGTSPSWGILDWLRVLRGRVPGAHADRLFELAHEHGITDCLYAATRELSGGQRQRVALVRALLDSPKLILADEPTAGLDPPAAARCIAALRAVPGATLIVATHDDEVARRLPRVVALRGGRVTYDGPCDDQAIQRIYATAGRSP